MLFSNNKLKTYAFVGPSGTGKSYRAQYVANESGIKYIIDDGLLIYGNRVLAGESAKKAPTKIATVRNALFEDPEQNKLVQKAIKKYKPDKILILGTSDGMVSKIAANLDLPPITETIYIQDVATEEEMKTARKIRTSEGKHVVPVPTFEIKKDFSGLLVDPLQIFKSNGKGKAPYVSEKSIIRPTFSYMGKFEISDNVFKQIIDVVVKDIEGVHKIYRARISKHAKYNDGIFIYLEVIIEFGYNVNDTIQELKEKIIKEVEKLTAMNVLNMEIIVKDVHYSEE